MIGEKERLVANLVQETRTMAWQMARYYDAVADQLGLHVTDLTCLRTLTGPGPRHTPASSPPSWASPPGR